MTDPGSEKPDRRLADTDDPTVIMVPARPDLKPPPKQRERGRLVLYVVACVLAVAVVVGVVIAVSRGSGGSPAAATYQVRQDGAVVVAGQPTARTTIDIYEDYLCPGCARLEQNDGAALADALNNGQIQVRYHAVLVHHDALDASNAALCAVPAGVFPAYHSALFEQQTTRDKAALIALGKELGAQGDFEQCVSSGKNNKAIQTETQRATSDKTLRGEQGFGTPMVLVNGKKIDLRDSSWLKTAIQQG